MSMYDKRWYAYHVPTNYSRITPERGSGFILNKLYFWGPLTRKQIFENSKYGKYRPGLLSILFTALMEDGLIEVSNGEMKKYRTPPSIFVKSKIAYRAWSKNGIPEYVITERGRRLVEEKFEGKTIPPRY